MKHFSPSNESLEDFVRHFAEHGGTDETYLRFHFPRFLATRDRFLSHHASTRGGRLLDIGAHWLHQALLYAVDGWQVAALDLPVTLGLPNVQAMARAHAIRLLPNEDLETPVALRELADDSFDVVLFTEVIEHLTFNPVALWREIYRVMKPGARIVITTPNYYALRRQLRQLLRSMQRLGGGVSVEQIVSLRTLGHHWKEYSRRELVLYFALLSPDFACRNFAYTEEYLPAFFAKPGGRLVQWLERAIPFLRPDLYLEVELTRKENGIVVEPHW